MFNTYIIYKTDKTFNAITSLIYLYLCIKFITFYFDPHIARVPYTMLLHSKMWSDKTYQISHQSLSSNPNSPFCRTECATPAKTTGRSSLVIRSFIHAVAMQVTCRSFWIASAALDGLFSPWRGCALGAVWVVVEFVFRSAGRAVVELFAVFVFFESGRVLSRLIGFVV